MEFREIIFTKQLTKVIFLQVFSVPKNGLEWNSKGFSLAKMIQNGIPRFFLFQKWFGMEFQGFLSYKKWFRMEFGGFFSSKKWFGMEFPGFFLFREMVRKGIPRVFLFREMVRNGIPRFSLPQNMRSSDGTVVCSVLFHIPRNNFLSENGNPKFHPHPCKRCVDV
jgi:hypothetical protein